MNQYNNTALLLIDVQKGFDESTWGKRNNLEAEENIALLLASWRKNALPIIHIRHNSTNKTSPLHPSHKGNEFKEIAKPLESEVVFGKNVNSAFIGTDLQNYLNKNNINQLVILGLTTDHCVSTTTRMAANLGFEVTLVSDASATFDRTDQKGNYYSAETMHTINLVSLDGEFCQVKLTNELLEETKNVS
ncbi:MAG: cysteine hydrolase family protein [Cellvibrionaceae bacterium]